MKNKKIAVCVSGQPRGIPYTLYPLMEKLLKPNNITDVFLHSWFDPKQVGNVWNSIQPHRNNENKNLGSAVHVKDVGYIKPDMDKTIVDFLKPTKHIIEPQRDFSEYNTILSKKDSRCDPEILVSMFYSMWMANQLKTQYELEENFKYDIVVRVRTDMNYTKNLHLYDYYNPEIDNNKIVVDEKYQQDQENLNLVDKPMVDTFSFGGSDDMNKLCNVYSNVKLINNEISIPLAENYLGLWVQKKNGIVLKKENLGTGILPRTTGIDLSTL